MLEKKMLFDLNNFQLQTLAKAKSTIWFNHIVINNNKVIHFPKIKNQESLRYGHADPDKRFFYRMT